MKLGLFPKFHNHIHSFGNLRKKYSLYAQMDSSNSKKNKIIIVSPFRWMCCTLGCSQGLWLWSKHVNKFPLSPLIINDPISSWVVWQICHRFIVDCLAGSHLSQNKLNKYWFPVSEAPWWIVSLRWENEHTQYLSVHFCWWVLYDLKKKKKLQRLCRQVCWIHMRLQCENLSHGIQQSHIMFIL